MNKNEFLNQLEALLADISPTEKEEAMQYYRESWSKTNSIKKSACTVPLS